VLSGAECLPSDPSYDCYAYSARAYDTTVGCLSRVGSLACCSVSLTQGIPASEYCSDGAQVGCVVNGATGGIYFTPEVWTQMPSGYAACAAPLRAQIVRAPQCTN